MMIRSSMRTLALLALIAIVSVPLFLSFSHTNVLAQSADIVDQSIDDVQEVDAASAPDAEEIRGLILFANPNVISDGQTVTFVASVSNGNNIKWTWDFGDGTRIGPEAGSGQSIRRDHTFRLQNPAVAQTFTVSLNASNANNPGGVTVTETVEVRIQAPTGLTVSHQANFGTANQTYTFAASVQNGGGVSYTWDFGDGTVIQNGPAVVNHAYARQGAYLLVVTARNTGGEAIYSEPITIWAERVTECSITVQGRSETNNELTLTPNSNGTGVEYTWNFGDGTEPVTINSKIPIRHTYTRADTYNVDLTCKNTSSSKSATRRLNIIDPPPKPITWLHIMSSASLQSPQLIDSDSRAQFSANTGDATNVTYIWNFGDGTSLTTKEEAVEHNYADVGGYLVSVIAANSISSMTKSITAHATDQLNIRVQTCPELQYRRADGSEVGGDIFVSDEVLLTYGSATGPGGDLENTEVVWRVTDGALVEGAAQNIRLGGPNAIQTDNSIVLKYKSRGQYVEAAYLYYTINSARFVCSDDVVIPVFDTVHMPFFRR